MRSGRPRKVRRKKRFNRKFFGAARRGAANPKQKRAARGRARARRR